MWTCAKQHKPPVPEPGSRPEFAGAVPGTQLVGRETAAPDALAAETVQRARAYLLAARADSTRRAYANDWVHFTDWCTSQHDEGGGLLGYLPAAPETVAIYLAEHAGTLKVATLIRRCSAISAVHQAAGHPSPTASPLVRTTLAGIRRVHGISPAAKDPLVAHQVRRLLDALPKEPAKALLAARDRALLVLGFYGALRRSELVALDTGDVEVNDQGLVVALRRSKTDQDAAGRRIAMLHTGAADSCPAEVYLAWLAALDTALPPLFGQEDDDRWVVLVDGQPRRPVFRPVNRHGQPAPSRLTDKAVARVVQRTALRAGLGDLDLAGHSLRAGFATSAAAAGKSERAIMKQTGHKSLPMVRRYIREGSLFRDNATEGLTL
jgi:integrase